MNTQPTPERFNAVDVSQWIKDEAEKSGIPDLLLSIGSYCGKPVHAWVWKSGGSHGAYGSTIEEAIAALRLLINPVTIARAKLAEAEKLLADAQRDDFASKHGGGT